jgi:hypothetical protein
VVNPEAEAAVPVHQEVEEVGKEVCRSYLMVVVEVRRPHRSCGHLPNSPLSWLVPAISYSLVLFDRILIHYRTMYKYFVAQNP